MDNEEGSLIDQRITPLWHIGLAIVLTIILFLIGPVDISEPHLVKPTVSTAIIIIILLIAIWVSPHSPEEPTNGNEN